MRSLARGGWHAFSDVRDYLCPSTIQVLSVKAQFSATSLAEDGILLSLLVRVGLQSRSRKAPGKVAPPSEEATPSNGELSAARPFRGYGRRIVVAISGSNRRFSPLFHGRSWRQSTQPSATDHDDLAGDIAEFRFLC
jgi:hypothetical protein